MITLTKWMLAPALAACFLFAGDTSTANAQYGSCNAYGGYSSGYRAQVNPYYGLRSSYPSIRAHYSSAYRTPQRRYHDTSHYDYHPTEIRRHRNHFDVTPGHYDFHRQGHFDRH